MAGLEVAAEVDSWAREEPAPPESTSQVAAMFESQHYIVEGATLLRPDESRRLAGRTPRFTSSSISRNDSRQGRERRWTFPRASAAASPWRQEAKGTLRVHAYVEAV